MRVFNFIFAYEIFNYIHGEILIFINFKISCSMNSANGINIYQNRKDQKVPIRVFKDAPCSSGIHFEKTTRNRLMVKIMLTTQDVIKIAHAANGIKSAKKSEKAFLKV